MGVHCRICGSLRLRPLFRASYYVGKPTGVLLYHCKDCGTVSSNDALASYDDQFFERCDAYNPGAAEHQQRNDLFRARVRYLDEQVGAGRILDVGCARGDFLNRARERGFETYGIEISRDAAALAAQHGHRVSTGSAEQLPFEANSFIAVHMNHVLEHVNVPVDALASIRRVLAPGGLAIVEVPNELGPLAVRLKLQVGTLGVSGSKQIRYAPHLTYFTMRSLRALVHASGLRIVRERIRFYGPISPMLRTIPAQVARLYDRLTKNGDLLEVTLRK